MRKQTIIYIAGSCVICGQGELYIVKDPLLNGKLLVICDDCESKWESPEKVSYKNCLPDKQRIEEDEKLKTATLEEIEACGWEKYITGSTVEWEE